MRTVSRVGIVTFAIVFVATAGALAAEPIKIGMVQPLTGPVSFGGNTLLNGARLALDEINAKGGALGKKLELVPEDGQCVPPKSVNAAEKLIVRDKVSVILGAYCSSSSAAVKPIAAKYRVPLVTGVSTSPKLTESETEWFFRAQGTSAMYADAIAPKLRAMGLKKMAFLVINDDWGRGVAEEFGRAFKALGGGVVETLIYDRKETDLSSYLTKIRSLGVDSVGTACYTPHCIAIAKQSKQADLRAQIVGEGAWTTAPFYRGAAAAGDGVLGFVEYVHTLDTPLNRGFVGTYKAKYGEDPTKYSAAGHTLVHIVAQAIQRAGSADPKAIRDALEKTDYTGLVGNYRFNEAHQAYGFDYYVTKNVGGAPQVLHTVRIQKP